jgi:hypothetical protein
MYGEVIRATQCFVQESFQSYNRAGSTHFNSFMRLLGPANIYLQLSAQEINENKEILKVFLGIKPRDPHNRSIKLFINAMKS